MSRRRPARPEIAAPDEARDSAPCARISLVRWDELFADLESQAGQLAAQERASEVGELARAELAKIRLVERMLPSLGATLAVRCIGDVRVGGELVRVGPDWLLLDEGHGREAVVALPAVLSVGGLVRLSAAAGSVGRVESRIGMRSALRGVARDRSPVRVHLGDGAVLAGTIDRVGDDFFELATHPGGDLRRRAEVREVLVVPHHAVSVVRRDG